MIGVNYLDELFALVGIPAKFWELIRKDLRFDDRLEKVEGFLLFILPGLVPLSLVLHFQVSLGKGFYSVLIAASTLFVGFSMNAVLLLLRYSSVENSSALLIDQTRNIISYLLYLGVALASVGVLGYLLSSLKEELPSFILVGASAISVFLAIHFLIVVLLLPARVFTIIEGSTETTY